MASVSRGGSRSGIELRKFHYRCADGLPPHGRQYGAAAKASGCSGPSESETEAHASIYLIFGTVRDPVCIRRNWYAGGSVSEGEEPND